MVGDSPDVEAVSLGETGIISGGSSGLMHIDCTTMSPGVTRQIAEAYAAKGIEMLDAPVSGGDAGAKNATLSIMVGGKQDVFERCKPLFEVVGKTITYCGPIGAGQTVKLCNQVAVSVTNMAVCEALVLAAKAGVSTKTMLRRDLRRRGLLLADGQPRPEDDRRRLRPGLQGVAPAEGPAARPRSRPRERPADARDGPRAQLFASIATDGHKEAGTQALVKALEKLGSVSVAG